VLCANITTLNAFEGDRKTLWRATCGPRFAHSWPVEV